MLPNQTCIAALLLLMSANPMQLTSSTSHWQQSDCASHKFDAAICSQENSLPRHRLLDSVAS